jgi:hypothetical protein
LTAWAKSPARSAQAQSQREAILPTLQAGLRVLDPWPSANGLAPE